MTDAVGTIGMFAEVDKPAKKNMERVDVRLPREVAQVLEGYAFHIGLSTSELVRFMVIEGLEKRGAWDSWVWRP